VDNLPTITSRVAISEYPHVYIANIITKHNAKIIGICGPSGSGKTTFAKKLAETLGNERCLVLKVDHYWRFDRSEMGARGLTGYDWETRDRNRFLKDFEALKSGCSIDKPLFDYTYERPANRTEVVEPKEIIILEDTLDFTELTDLSVFTYAPDEILIKRRLERDKYKKSFESHSDLEAYIRIKSIPAYKAKLLPVASKSDYIVDTHSSNTIYKVIA
jgi:uridine kinase